MGNRDDRHDVDEELERPRASPLSAIRAQVVAVMAACEAILEQIDALPVRRPAPPEVRRDVFATFDGDIHVGPPQPPPIGVDSNGDITRPRMEG